MTGWRDLCRSPARRLAVLALALGTLAACAAGPADGRLAANPALARIAAADPAEARRLLGAAEEALRRPPPPRMRGSSPGLDAADEALLAGNPLLGQVYAHDPAAALALLERVKGAGGRAGTPHQ